MAKKLKPVLKGPWTGVDLDGTFAHYDRAELEKHGPEHIGEPIKPILNMIKRLVREGKRVKIMTARVAGDRDGKARRAIVRYCEKHVGCRLEVTCVKDFEMVALYDDRAFHVVENTGKIIRP